MRGGYALIRKSTGRTPGEIPIEEMTGSIFRHGYLRAMFGALTGYGLWIGGDSPGISHMTKGFTMPSRDVTISQLTSDGCEAFNAAPNVSIAAGRKLFGRIKEKGETTAPAQSYFQREFEKQRGAGLMEGRDEGQNLPGTPISKPYAAGREKMPARLQKTQYTGTGSCRNTIRRELRDNKERRTESRHEHR